MFSIQFGATIRIKIKILPNRLQKDRKNRPKNRFICKNSRRKNQQLILLQSAGEIPTLLLLQILVIWRKNELLQIHQRLRKTTRQNLRRSRCQKITRIFVFTHVLFTVPKAHLFNRLTVDTVAIKYYSCHHYPFILLSPILGWEKSGGWGFWWVSSSMIGWRDQYMLLIG